MGISNTFIEDFRLELQNALQALLTYNPGGGPVEEAKVVNEFTDVPEIYPCVVIDIGASNSPSRYVGTRDNLLLSIGLPILAVRPSAPGHVITCEDSVPRSGRALVEYLAIKVDQFVETFVPSFSYIESGHDLVLNLDHEERDDVYKSMVQYELLV